MAYSRWRDGAYFYTTPLTGAPTIQEAVLFINPRVGNSTSMTYAQLKALDLDTNWVALTFPDCPQQLLAQLLFFIDAFVTDMEKNVYRYHGLKQPIVGVTHEHRQTRPANDTETKAGKVR